MFAVIELRFSGTQSTVQGVRIELIIYRQSGMRFVDPSLNPEDLDIRRGAAFVTAWAGNRWCSQPFPWSLTPPEWLNRIWVLPHQFFSRQTCFRSEKKVFALLRSDESTRALTSVERLS